MVMVAWRTRLREGVVFAPRAYWTASIEWTVLWLKGPAMEAHSAQLVEMGVLVVQNAIYQLL